jgi:hypothetical protein
MTMEIHPIGNHWFKLYRDSDSMEYNPGPNPTATLQDERNPLACVFPHIDGDNAIAKIYGVTEKAFFYKNSGRKQALQQAKDFIDAHFKEKEIQTDIFE